MKPIFFKNPSDFRKWFEKNADTATQLLVGFYMNSAWCSAGLCSILKLYLQSAVCCCEVF